MASKIFATRDPEKAGLENYPPIETNADLADHFKGRQFSVVGENEPIVTADTTKLKRALKGRHMQMIAIGGAIGAGLFVGSGSALHTGGPGSLVICFIIIVSASVGLHLVLGTYHLARVSCYSSSCKLLENLLLCTLSTAPSRHI